LLTKGSKFVVSNSIFTSAARQREREIDTD
jgi:hypothetical protein